MRALPFRWALALFVLSGATGLVDQVVWLKYLSFSFGNTTQASAILLGVFMGGLAAGAWACGRSRRLAAHEPVLVYGVFEGLIGLLAALSPLFFVAIDAAYVALYRAAGPDSGLFVPLRVLLAALFLLPPTFLMGGTLPILSRAFEVEGAARGRAAGLLYAWNTAGALLGTLLATYVLIPRLGLRATLFASASANLAILLGVLVARRRAGGISAATAAAGAPEALETGPPPAPLWLGLFFVVGFASLAYEVVWTRILVFFLGSSVFAFGTMLATILLGLALGSALGALLLPRVRRPALLLALLELGVAAGALLQLRLFPGHPDRMAAAASFFGPSVTPLSYGASLLLATAPSLLLPTLLMGAAFPVAIRLASPTGEAGRGVGRVYAANTFGAIAGSLAGGFFLVPLLGTQAALLFLAGLNLLVALAAFAVAPGSSPARLSARRLAPAAALLVAAGAGLVVLSLSLPPTAILEASGVLSGEGARVVHFEEDATCTVAVRELGKPPRTTLSLEVNGVNVAGSSADLVAIQKLQGHLPLLVHGDAKRVLHIGFGSGGTAYAVSRHPVVSIAIAEISAAVLRASDRSFPAINHGVLSDPRVRVVLNDGRNHVLAANETFDVLLSDSIHPRYAGNGSLYTEDYFRLCARRLAPGGVISMWLPIYSLDEENLRQVVRAFANVFPGATVWYPSSTLNPFLVVLARAGSFGVDVDRFLSAWRAPGIAAELSEIGYPEPADVLSDLVLAGGALARWLGDAEPHVDDKPVVEYVSGLVVSRSASWLDCFGSVLRMRTAPEAGLFAASEAGRSAIREAVRRAEAKRPLLKAQYDVLKRAVESGGEPPQGLLYYGAR